MLYFIALILVFDDWRKGQIRKPYLVVADLWAIGMIGFYNLYKFSWRTDFANWYGSFG